MDGLLLHVWIVCWTRWNFIRVFQPRWKMMLNFDGRGILWGRGRKKSQDVRKDRAPQVALVIKNHLPMQRHKRLGFDPWVGGRAWQPTPWSEESGGLQSTGSQRVRHDWSVLAHRHREGLFVDSGDHQLHSNLEYRGLFWRWCSCYFLLPGQWGSLHVFPNHVHVPHTCTIQIHRNSSEWLVRMSIVHGKQYGVSSNTTNRTCIGPHSLTSDYYIQRKQNQYIFKEYLFIYLTLVGLSCGSWDLHCITQDVSSWHGGSGVCSLCLCSAWA